jgi:hypothetical protein
MKRKDKLKTLVKKKMKWCNTIAVPGAQAGRAEMAEARKVEVKRTSVLQRHAGLDSGLI